MEEQVQRKGDEVHANGNRSSVVSHLTEDSTGNKIDGPDGLDCFERHINQQDAAEEGTINHDEYLGNDYAAAGEEEVNTLYYYSLPKVKKEHKQLTSGQRRVSNKNINNHKQPSLRLLGLNYHYH